MKNIALLFVLITVLAGCLPQSDWEPHRYRLVDSATNKVVSHHDSRKECEEAKVRAKRQRFSSMLFCIGRD